MRCEERTRRCFLRRAGLGAAGVACCLALDRRSGVADVDAARLRRALAAGGTIVI